MAAARVEPETIDEGALGLPAGAADQRGRAPLPGRRRSRADADRRPRPRRRDRRRARPAPTPSAGRPSARWPTAPRRRAAALPAEQAEAPGARARRGGLAPRRRRDRRLAPRRPPLAAGGAALRSTATAARGSARSIPGFDLIAALDACSEHLTRHGGHRAAAGLELPRDRVDAFREAFVAHAAEAIDPEQLVRTEHVDALVGVGRDGIGMELAEQLERLAPFGHGQPRPAADRALRAAAHRAAAGRGGQALALRPRERRPAARRASPSASTARLESRQDQSLDLSVRVEVDRWNGAVQPRVVLRELYPLAEPAEGAEGIGCAEGGCPSSDAEWWARLEAEAGRADGVLSARARAPGRDGAGARDRRSPGRRRGGSDRRAGLQRRAGARALRGRAPPPSPGRLGRGPAPFRSREAGARLLPLRGPRARERRCDGRRRPRAVGLGRAGAAARRGRGASRTWSWSTRRPFEPLEELARLGRRVTCTSPGGLPRLELAGRCLALEWEPRGAVEQIWRLLAKRGGEAARRGAALAARGRRRVPPHARARRPLRGHPRRARALRVDARFRRSGAAGLILGADPA